MAEARFSGDPKTIWLSEASADRRMELIEAFWFEDRAGRRWDAGAGSIVDGASIPPSLWALVGSPYTGDYRRASIVHDIAAVEAGSDYDRRLAADKMFYEACRAGGCSVWDATILFIGVRIGAWSPLATLVETPIRKVKLQRDVLDLQIESDFRVTCELVLSQGETDDADEIAARTEAALGRIAGLHDLAAESAFRAGPVASA